MSESNAVGNQRANPLARLAAARSGARADGRQTMFGRDGLVDAFAEVFASMAVAESPQRREASRLDDQPPERESVSANSARPAHRPLERNDPPPHRRDRPRSEDAVAKSPAAEESVSVKLAEGRSAAATDTGRPPGAEESSPESESADGSPVAPPVRAEQARELQAAGTFSAPVRRAETSAGKEAAAPEAGNGETARQSSSHPDAATKPAPVRAAVPETANPQPTAPAQNAGATAAAGPVESASRASTGESFEQGDPQSQGRLATDREAASDESESESGRGEKGSKQASEDPAAAGRRSQRSLGATPPNAHASASPQTHPSPAAAAASATRTATQAGSGSSHSASANASAAGRAASGVSPLRPASNPGGTSANAMGSDPAAPADKSSQAKPSPAGSRAGNTTRSSATDAVSRAKLVQRVSKAFQHLGPGGGTVRLRLAPAELGTVRVEMRIQNKQVHARVIAETDAASGILREHLPDLRSRLEAQGMQLERVEIETEERETRSSGSFDGDASGGRGGEPRNGAGWQQRYRRSPAGPPQREPAETPGGQEPPGQLAAVNVGSPSAGVDIRF